MRIVFVSRSVHYRDFAERIAVKLPTHQLVIAEDGRAPDLEGAQALVTAGASVGRDLLAASSLGFVQTLGTGFENVDVPAATQLGVWVAHMRASATGNAESVAEHAVLLLLALCRKLPAAREALSRGAWAQPQGMALLGRTVCVVGLGAIGTALAVRLRAFGMRVVGVREHPERGGPEGVEVLGADALHRALGEADCVVLTLRADARNTHLLDEAALAAMKPGALLVNVARGSLVKPEALEAALRSGRLAGAGLDVFWKEPVDPGHPLLHLPQVIATPHVAGVTDVNLARSTELIARNLEAFARGARPDFLVNAPPSPRQPLT